MPDTTGSILGQLGRAARYCQRCLVSCACPTSPSCFFFSSRRRHTRSDRDWSSDVCSSDLLLSQITAIPADSRLQVTFGSSSSGTLAGLLYLDFPPVGSPALTVTNGVLRL